MAGEEGGGEVVPDIAPEAVPAVACEAAPPSASGGVVAEPAEARKDEAAAEQVRKAMEAKEQGADLYKKQQYIEAKQAWLGALVELPAGSEDSVEGMKKMCISLRLNLSMVSLQLNEYEMVIEHATHVLKLQPDSSKAFYRRGLASDHLGRPQQAAQDLQKAARIEPRNADIRKKYEEVKQRYQAAQEKKDEEERPPEHDLASLPLVYLDVRIGDAPPARMVFALYVDSAPRTAENFRQLCTGEHEGLTARRRPFHYKGSVLHRMIPGLMVQGGDFENSNGTGGESIYGRRFPDEFLVEKFTRRGQLAMANDGPNTNGSNFFVTFLDAEHLDRHHVIFGELVDGWQTLDDLEKLQTDEENRPITDCIIVDCGDLGKA